METFSESTSLQQIIESHKGFLKQVFSKYDDIDDAFLADVSKQIVLPPQKSILRINTLTCTEEEGFNLAKNFFQSQDEGYEVYRHTSLSDIVVIDPIKVAKTIAPAPFEIIVSQKAAESSLRGADIFVPGIVAIDGRARAGSLVSVWLDVESKCTKGAKEVYQGRKHFVGNGILKMVRIHYFIQIDVWI